MSEKTPPTGIVTRREATIAPSSVNRESRTADLVWTTGAKVMRHGWDGSYFEELSLDPKHVRMERLASGRAPLLANHDAHSLDAVIGVVESARLEKGRGVARVRFADDEASERVFKKVESGILRAVSFGYRIHKFQKVEGGDEKTPTFRAVDYEPFELSIVPIGADAAAHVRSESPNAGSRNEEAMTVKTEGVTDPSGAEQERARVTAIMSLCRSLKMDQGFMDEAIRRNLSIDLVREQALDILVKRDEETPTFTPHRGMDNNYPSATQDADNRIRSMAEALAARHGGPVPKGEAQQYMRLSAVDMARHLLEVRNVSTRMLSPNQIISRAYATTSDFSALLQETGNRFLRQSYEQAPSGLKVICRKSTAPDFRAKSYLQLSEAPTLEKVNEHGEFKRGAMSEAKESYRLATYGRTFALSRQALVNDDLNSFSEMFRKLGQAAAEFEAKQLTDLLTSNPTMAQDSTALFHADHGNLAGSGAAISITTLGAALKAMRLQTGLDSVTPIAVSPRYLVVPAALEVVALQYTAQLRAIEANNVNPFASALSVVVDPRLDASSTTAWYVAADPNVIPSIEYAHLDGEEGPQIETRSGFEVDGTEFKVRLDFGAGVLDWRGIYKNTGA